MRALVTFSRTMLKMFRTRALPPERDKDGPLQNFHVRPPRPFVPHGKAASSRIRIAGQHSIGDLLANHAVDPRDIELAQRSSQRHNITPVGARRERLIT